MKTMERAFPIIAATLLLLFGGGCEEDSGEAKGTLVLSGPSALILPPGHPGYVSDQALIIPSYPDPPPVREADCFSGVPNPGDIGIGSAVGYSKSYMGSVSLPVNVNLGDTILGEYKIRVEVSHPSLAIDPAGVVGSYPWLATDNCLDRGCAPVCEDYPSYYPRQFNPAPGFEPAPQVTGSSAGITVEAVDATTATPATGTVNLCHIKINIVDDLPPSGATVSFFVMLLKGPAGNDISHIPTPHGIIIKRFKYQ